MGKKKRHHAALIKFLDGVRDLQEWVDYDEVDQHIEALIEIFHDTKNAPGGNQFVA